MDRVILIEFVVILIRSTTRAGNKRSEAIVPQRFLGCWVRHRWRHPNTNARDSIDIGSSGTG